MIVIYTKDNCSACVRAKNLMKSRDIPFSEIKIGEDVTVDEVKALFPHFKTVPIVIKDAVLVGGYVELVERIAANSNFGKLLLNE